MVLAKQSKKLASTQSGKKQQIHIFQQVEHKSGKVNVIGLEKDRENGGAKERKYLVSEGERELPNKKVISVHPFCMHTKNNLNSTKKKVSETHTTIKQLQEYSGVSLQHRSNQKAFCLTERLCKWGD